MKLNLEDPIAIAPSLFDKRDWNAVFPDAQITATLPSRAPFLYVSHDLFIDYRWERLLETRGEAHLLIYGDGRGQLSLDELQPNDLSIRELSPETHADGLSFAGISRLTKLPPKGREVSLSLPGQKAVLAEKKWPSSKLRPAIFLDRDGIIIEDIDYVADYQEVTVKKDFLSALRAAVAQDVLFFVVTNQSGIGRGYFTEDEVRTLHRNLHRHLEEELGISIAEWTFCPYHKIHAHGELKKDSFSRKPYPGMVLDLCQRHPVDLEQSWMIGDQRTDRLLLPPLKTLHLKGLKDLSGAIAPIFSRPEELVQYMKEYPQS